MITVKIIIFFINIEAGNYEKLWKIFSLLDMYFLILRFESLVTDFNDCLFSFDICFEVLCVFRPGLLLATNLHLSQCKSSTKWVFSSCLCGCLNHLLHQNWNHSSHKNKIQIFKSSPGSLWKILGFFQQQNRLLLPHLFYHTL